jgi:hypothetical protein
VDDYIAASDLGKTGIVVFGLCCGVEICLCHRYRLLGQPVIDTNTNRALVETKYCVYPKRVVGLRMFFA